MATAHLCRGRGPLTWLCMWLGSAPTWEGLGCTCPRGEGDPCCPPRAFSMCLTHTYLPQGEGQPGQSSQKGGWYPSRHWQRLQWQVPRRLHSLWRVFKQPSVDFLHWQALPWYPGMHLHSPQSHKPRSAGEDLSDQNATEIAVALPLSMLGKHYPPCVLHATLHGVIKEVLQAGAVGPLNPPTWVLAGKGGIFLGVQCPDGEPIMQMHHLCHHRGIRYETRSSCCRTRRRCRRYACQAHCWYGRRTARRRSPPAPSR